MPVFQKLNQAAPSLNIAALTNEGFADVITDALVVVSYVPKLIIDKKYSQALTTVLLVVNEYGNNFTTIFKEVWEAYKAKNSDDMALIWDMVKSRYDLPIEYDEYEATVEKYARLPILSAGQVNDLVKLVSLLLTEIKGKNFFEAVAVLFGEFKQLSAEFSDTLAIVREWIALFKVEEEPTPEG